MVYIEVQDNKLMFEMKKKKDELQSVSFDWYSIGTRSIESCISTKSANVKRT